SGRCGHSGRVWLCTVRPAARNRWEPGGKRRLLPASFHSTRRGADSADRTHPDRRTCPYPRRPRGTSARADGRSRGEAVESRLPASHRPPGRPTSPASLPAPVRSLLPKATQRAPAARSVPFRRRGLLGLKAEGLFSACTLFSRLADTCASASTPCALWLW